MDKANDTVLIFHDSPLISSALKKLLLNKHITETVHHILAEHELFSHLEAFEINTLIIELRHALKLPEKFWRENTKINIVVIASQFKSKEVGYLLEISDSVSFLSLFDSENEILSCMEHAIKGETCFSNHATPAIVEFIQEKKSPSNLIDSLTRREEQILLLVVDGLTTKEISDETGTSARTVEVHKRNIMSKLKVRNTAGIIKYAYENGIVKAKGN